MRKTTIIYIALLSLAYVSCKENATAKIDPTNIESAKERDSKINLGGAIIEFDKSEYDFGTINEDDIIEGAFLITNKGKIDLVITNARASCGCTVAEWPKEAIKPGESADLKFKFNSRGKSGKQNKSITLETNTENGIEVLRLTGMITPKMGL